MLADRRRPSPTGLAHIPAVRTHDYALVPNLRPYHWQGAVVLNPKRAIDTFSAYTYTILGVVLGVTLVVSLCVVVSCHCRRRRLSLTLDAERKPSPTTDSTGSPSNVVPMLANGHSAPESESGPLAEAQFGQDYRYRERTIRRDGELRVYAATVGSAESDSVSRTQSVILVANPPGPFVPAVTLPSELQAASLARSLANRHGEDGHMTPLRENSGRIRRLLRSGMRRGQTMGFQSLSDYYQHPPEYAASRANERWRFSESAQTHSTEPLPEYATLPPSPRAARASLDSRH